MLLLPTRLFKCGFFVFDFREHSQNWCTGSQFASGPQSKLDQNVITVAFILLAEKMKKQTVWKSEDCMYENKRWGSREQVSCFFFSFYWPWSKGHRNVFLFCFFWCCDCHFNALLPSSTNVLLLAEISILKETPCGQSDIWHRYEARERPLLPSG